MHIIEYARKFNISLQYLINGRYPYKLDDLYRPYIIWLNKEAHTEILEMIGNMLSDFENIELADIDIKLICIAN